jgi:hypothetical protein
VTFQEEAGLQKGDDLLSLFSSWGRRRGTVEAIWESVAPERVLQPECTALPNPADRQDDKGRLRVEGSGAGLMAKHM